MDYVRCAGPHKPLHSEESSRSATVPDVPGSVLHLVLHGVMKVHFSNVGRNKESWTSEYSELSVERLAEEAKNRGRLMSSEVDVELNDTASAGVVLVGGWRQVGTLTIERK